MSVTAALWEGYVTRWAPNAERWALGLEVLEVLEDLVRARRPELVVDVGSGLSTIVLAELRRELGFRLWAFDDSDLWARRTEETARAMLGEHVRVERWPGRLVELADLAVYDLGSTWPTRVKWMDAVCAGARVVVADDCQLRQVRERFVALRPNARELTHRDAFGRYAMVSEG